MSRLLSSQTSKKKEKKFFCLRCLNPFGSEELLQSHTEYCSDKEAVRTELPKKGTILKFKNNVVYADFESLTEKGPRQDIEKGCFTHQQSTPHMDSVTLSSHRYQDVITNPFFTLSRQKMKM
jgi:hypothetical protein